MLVTHSETPRSFLPVLLQGSQSRTRTACSWKSLKSDKNWTEEHNALSTLRSLRKVGMTLFRLQCYWLEWPPTVAGEAVPPDPFSFVTAEADTDGLTFKIPRRQKELLQNCIFPLKSSYFPRWSLPQITMKTGGGWGGVGKVLKSVSEPQQTPQEFLLSLLFWLFPLPTLPSAAPLSLPPPHVSSSSSSLPKVELFVDSAESSCVTLKEEPHSYWCSCSLVVEDWGSHAPHPPSVTLLQLEILI